MTKGEREGGLEPQITILIINIKTLHSDFILVSWNYNTNWNNMKENPLLYARLS